MQNGCEKMQKCLKMQKMAKQQLQTRQNTKKDVEQPQRDAKLQQSDFKETQTVR